MVSFKNASYEPSLFSPHIKISCPVHNTRVKRFSLYDTERDLYFILGEFELYIACLFDGSRSRNEIVELIFVKKNKTISLEKLIRFEKKLLNLGILHSKGNTFSKYSDPFAGITYGPLKALLMIPLFRIRPQKTLDRLVRLLPILIQQRFVFSCLMMITGAVVIVLINWASFSRDIAIAYSSGAWILLHYPILIVSVTFHELGHTLACYAYGVHVREMGLAIYLLLVTGWSRPVQSQWNSLGKTQRIITILMGPFVSLVFSAIGVFIWFIAVPQSYLASIGIVMAVNSTLALIPTLLPVFNGDGYLVITEYFEVPGIRQKALNFVRKSMFKKKDRITIKIDRQTQILYCAVTVGIVFSWVVSIVLLFNVSAMLYEAGVFRFDKKGKNDHEQNSVVRSSGSVAKTEENIVVQSTY